MKLNMTKKEIYYKCAHADDPKLQIGILADENGVQPAVIRAIVEKMAALETDKLAPETEAVEPTVETTADISPMKKIVELYNAGKTYKQISEELNITCPAVTNRISRLLRGGVIQYRLPRKKNAPKPVAADKDAHKKLTSDNIIPQSAGNVKGRVKPTLNTEGGTT